MDQRLNLGSEVRELKLGSTFNTPKPRTSFHTLKYDFKPASVDLTKTATLDVSSNNQVTVTMPHLDSSGVPKTVFKGNQRNYTKECVLIIDKTTGEITLEKLHHNIQVKKTRSEPNNRSASGTVLHQSTSNSRPALENNTQRVSNKTKVSTGVRKSALGSFVQRHSPIQGSPSYPHHRSPQQAPVWNANNGQSTLPSIPMIGIDDDFFPTTNITSNSTATSASTASDPSLLLPPQSSYHSLGQSTSSPVRSSGYDMAHSHSNHRSGSNHKYLKNQRSETDRTRSGVDTERCDNGGEHCHKNSSTQMHQSKSHQKYLPDNSEVGVLSSSDSSDSSDSDNDSGSDSDDDDDDDDDDDNNVQSQVI